MLGNGRAPRGTLKGPPGGSARKVSILEAVKPAVGVPWPGPVARFLLELRSGFW